MSKIIAVLNSKGGTGKTTISTNLAAGLAMRKHEVLIVDTDPQGSARDWQNARPEGTQLPPVVAVDRENARERDVPTLGKKFEFIVIDGAAKLELMAAAAVKVADFVLIPVQPSGFDIWAVKPLVEAIRTRQMLTDGRPAAAFVVSRQITGTQLASDVDAALENMGFPILRARTTQRVAYAEASQGGMTVLDYEPDGKAAEEVLAMTDEILEVLAHGQKNVA